MDAGAGRRLAPLRARRVRRPVGSVMARSPAQHNLRLTVGRPRGPIGIMGSRRVRGIRAAFAVCVSCAVLLVLALGGCTSVLGDFKTGNEPDGAVANDGSHMDVSGPFDTA